MIPRYERWACWVPQAFMLFGGCVQLVVAAYAPSPSLGLKVNPTVVAACEGWLLWGDPS